MGYRAVSTDVRGKYYLATREKAPFCAAQYKIRVEPTSGQGTTWGTLELSIRNESFALNDDELHDGDAIQGLVVASAPPLLTLAPPTQVTVTSVSNSPLSALIADSLDESVALRYVKYNGWIFSGKKEWSINQGKCRVIWDHRYNFIWSFKNSNTDRPRRWSTYCL